MALKICFIVLTSFWSTEKPIYINPTYIESIQAARKYTRIQMTSDGEDGFIRVEETPEKIIQLIKARCTDAT